VTNQLDKTKTNKEKRKKNHRFVVVGGGGKNNKKKKVENRQQSPLGLCVVIGSPQGEPLNYHRPTILYL
jgi:hypothetical protein